MFERAMKMFMPFPTGEATGGAAPTAGAKSDTPAASTDLDDMKRQLAEMQQKINKLSDK